MKCEELLKILSDYIDGEIDPRFCEGFERHLAECDPCQVVVDTIRKTITLYRNSEPLELPLEFRERLHRTLRERWKEKHSANELQGNV